MSGPDSGAQRDGTLLRDRFTPFFAIGFAVVTLADIGTTYICVHHYGLGEANPFTDTSSFWGLLWPELIGWVIGVIAVRCGYLMGRRDSFNGAAAGAPFKEFRRRLLSPRRLPFAVLVVIPIALVIGRLVPVAGNSSFILWGFDPYDEFLAWLIGQYDFSVYAAHAGSMVAVLAISTFLAIWLVFRLAKGR